MRNGVHQSPRTSLVAKPASGGAPCQQRTPWQSAIVPYSANAEQTGVTNMDWKPPIVINCCGRTISVTNACTSVSELQAALQDELGVGEQVFDIFDASGRRIMLDSDLVNALQENRAPLSATLSDTSIHVIENRREELAQMQWRLVRDQHAAAGQKTNAMGRSLQDLENRVNTHKQEGDDAIRMLKQELLAAVAAAEQTLHVEIKQLSERVAGTTQLVQIERNLREVSMEQNSKNIKALGETIDNDRAAVQQGSNVLLGHIDSVRKMVEAERSATEAIADKQKLDLQSVSERVEELMTTFQCSVSEFSRHLERATNQTAEAVESQGRSAQKVKQEVNSAVDATNSRVKLLEDILEALQAQVTEVRTYYGEQMDRVTSRQDKMSTAVETLRFDGSQHGLNLQALAQKLKDLDAAIESGQAQVVESVQLERKARETQFEGFRNAVKSDWERLRSSLESKIQATVAEESGMRQEHLSMVVNSIDSALRSQAAAGVNSSVNDSTDVSAIASEPIVKSTDTASRALATPSASTERSPSLGAGVVIQRPGSIVATAATRAGSPRHILASPTYSGQYPPGSPQRLATLPVHAAITTAFPAQTLPGAVVVPRTRAASANVRRCRSGAQPAFGR